MVPIRHFKGAPTEYVLAHRNGQIVRKGAAQSFWYWEPTTSITKISIATTDALFALNEITRDFQSVTLQGQVTYRVTDPEMLSQLLDFTIHPRTGQYLTDDPSKVSQRIINLVQMLTRQALADLGLEETLRSADSIAHKVLAALTEDSTLESLGIVCLALFFTAIRPTPDVAKALEAEHREALQRRADEAIYARRAEAVAQERKIKQNELSTSIELEQRRQELIVLEGENSLAQAASWAEATRLQLTPFDSIEPQRLVALAMRDLALNAQKIGNLTITTEILEQLLNQRQS